MAVQHLTARPATQAVPGLVRTLPVSTSSQPDKAAAIQRGVFSPRPTSASKVFVRTNRPRQEIAGATAYCWAGAGLAGAVAVLGAMVLGRGFGVELFDGPAAAPSAGAAAVFLGFGL